MWTHPASIDRELIIRLFLVGICSADVARIDDTLSGLVEVQSNGVRDDVYLSIDRFFERGSWFDHILDCLLLVIDLFFQPVKLDSP